jgi:hypothetical protein
MPALSIMEDLQVREERGGQLHPGRPSLPIQQLDLDTAPERLHQGVIEAATHRTHRGEQARILGPARERPRAELGALVTMNHRRASRVPRIDGHAQGVGHQRGGRRRIDGPTDHATGARVKHDRAVHLALAGGVLGDIRDPQLIRLFARELAADSIRGGGMWCGLPIAGAAGEPLDVGRAHQPLDRLVADADALPKD